MAVNENINKFLNSWLVDEINAKEAFLEYKKFAEKLPGAEMEFISRPGVSYSMRVKNKSSQKIAALIDVIDDDPDARWLSVCFYADMISDPQELGDFVPKGLMGEDAICFNLDENSGEIKTYINERLAEAAKNSNII